MSLVLDVVQKMILNSVYELTCTAAVQVFNKCKIMDRCAIKSSDDPDVKSTDNGKFKTNIEEPDPPGSQDPLVVEPKPSAKEIESRCVLSKLDVTYRNSGPICPPKTSSMRLARNSYFS